MDRTNREKYQLTCVTAAKNCIDEDIKRHYTLDEIALWVGLSQKQLVTGFRLLYGMGPFTYLKRRRLEIAKKLLERSPDIGVIGLAHTVGYLDPRSLTKAFKNEFHTSPEKMRARIRIKALSKKANEKRLHSGFPLW